MVYNGTEVMPRFDWERDKSVNGKERCCCFGAKPAVCCKRIHDGATDDVKNHFQLNKE